MIHKMENWGEGEIQDYKYEKSNILWMHRFDINHTHAKTTSWILEMQFSLPFSKTKKQAHIC